MDTVHQIISRRAGLAPQAPAILSLDHQPLTYQQLFQHLQVTQISLNELGIGRTDRLAIVLPNGPEMATAFLCAAACCVSAPLNPAYKAAEFEYYLSDLQVGGLLTLQGWETPARESARQLGVPVIELIPDAHVAGLFRLAGTPRSLTGAPGFAEAHETALLLHTSGTTSRPKIVPLTQANLAASAANIRGTLQLAETDLCLNIMPLFHIHGLMAAVLASMSAGAGVVCTPGFNAARFFEWLQVFKPSWYTAVPSMHQSILGRAAESAALLEGVHLRFVRSSSASLPPQVLAELEGVFHAPVIEAYGMTEACHQMACNPLPPQVHKPGSVGPQAGPDMAIMSVSGPELLPAGQTGEIVIRGANVTPGYLNNPKANESSFVNGWFRTGDQGYMDQEGYFFITGRLKELINRGGEKISPREIDEVLLDHPGVAQALAFAIPDENLGEVVGAAVVRRDPNLTEAELRRFAALRLSDFKVPAQIVFLAEIPKGPTGKLQRIGLAEKLGIRSLPVSSTEQPGEMVAPRTETEARLLELWQEVLNRQNLGVTRRFLDAGGDSVLAVQLLARLETAFDVRIEMLDFFDAPTISEQAVMIEALILDQLQDMSDNETAQFGPT